MNAKHYFLDVKVSLSNIHFRSIQRDIGFAEQERAHNILAVSLQEKLSVMGQGDLGLTRCLNVLLLTCTYSPVEFYGVEFRLISSSFAGTFPTKLKNSLSFLIT